VELSWINRSIRAKIDKNEFIAPFTILQNGGRIMPKTIPERYPLGRWILCGSLRRIYNSQVRIQTLRSLKEMSQNGMPRDNGFG